MKITKSKEEIAKQLGGNLVYGLGLDLDAGIQQTPIVNEEGELTGFDNEMNVPSTIKKIAANAFASKEISKVNLSEGLLEILHGAFYDNEIKSLVIPSTVTNLGYKEGFVLGTDKGAFEENLLTSVELGRVEKIGQLAFYNNELTDVAIPDSVTIIELYAFANNQLAELVIPDSVTVIGVGAFESNQLTELAIPDSVTTIEENAFSDNQLAELVIPDSVTTIEENAFANNNLTTVSVPYGKGTEWETAFDNGVVLVERPDPEAQ